jgi:hypothetical protein
MTVACVLVRGLHHEGARVAVAEVAQVARPQRTSPSRVALFESSSPLRTHPSATCPAPARFDFASSGFCFHGQGSRQPGTLTHRRGCSVHLPSRLRLR